MPTVRLIQVPYDSGWQDERMGRGPERLLKLGAAEALKRTAGSTEEITVRYEGKFTTEIGTTFALLCAIAEQVSQATDAGQFPIVLAGNCNSTVGALAGIKRNRVGLVWFDGHGDFHTPETTESGFLDGMGLAMAVGRCWTHMCSGIPGFQTLPEEQVALVGGRDLDQLERERLRSSAITHITLENVHKAGATNAMETVLASWAGKVDSVYLHVDMDVHDPHSTPANLLQPDGGFSPQEVRNCVMAITASYRLAGASITAYDPACDQGGRGASSCLALIELLGNIVHQQGG